jgi:hypothetical protein
LPVIGERLHAEYQTGSDVLLEEVHGRALKRETAATFEQPLTIRRAGTKPGSAFIQENKLS